MKKKVLANQTLVKTAEAALKRKVDLSACANLVTLEKPAQCVTAVNQTFVRMAPSVLNMTVDSSVYVRLDSRARSVMKWTTVDLILASTEEIASRRQMDSSVTAEPSIKDLVAKT